MVRTRARQLAFSLTFPKAIVCISNEKTLDAYNALALHNQAFSDEISSLELRLKQPFPTLTQKVRRLLSRLTHIDTLIIQLPRITSTECSALFRNLRFPNLALLSATLLPHSGIISFLIGNPHITTIILSNPTRCKCIRRPSLAATEISGPSSCVSALVAVSPSVRQITATYAHSRDTHTRLFTSLVSSPSHITYLHLDISTEHDSDILASIAASAPFVETLKLDEKFTSGQEHPWCDTMRWVLGLRRLESLSRFSLRTQSSLIKQPGNRLEEQRLISNWSGERTHYPRQLSSLTIWYLWGKETSYWSAWTRGAARWQRELSACDPAIQF